MSTYIIDLSSVHFRAHEIGEGHQFIEPASIVEVSTVGPINLDGIRFRAFMHENSEDLEEEE